MNPRTAEGRVVQVRFTGSKSDIAAAVAALGASCPGGWTLTIETSKDRGSGLFQTYGHLSKARGTR